MTPFLFILPSTLCSLALTLVPVQDCVVGAELKISGTSGGFGGALSPGDVFGVAIAPIGDLDGDGIGDLAVGAPLDDDGGADQGAVWILFMNADSTVKAEQKISETTGGFSSGTPEPLDPDDRFGTSIAALGDLDGDFVEDIAVGADRDDDGLGPDQGAIWILFLNTDGTVKAEQKISATAGGWAPVFDPSDNYSFGISCTALGDLDGDEVGDLAVGAEWDDDGGSNQGAVWILFLNMNGTVKGFQKISETEGGFGGDLQSNDLFGNSVAALTDLDGDGVQDLAVGEFLDDDGGTDQGAVWILFLNTDGTVKAEQKISATAGGFGGALDPSDRFGRRVSSLGDLDGNGVDDLVAGVYLDDDGGTDQGAVWILYLETDGTVRAEQKISADTGGFTGTLDPFDQLGCSVRGVGDLDGNGTDDLVVGACRDDDGGTDQGALWILFLEADTTPPALSCPPMVFAFDSKVGPPGTFVSFSVTAADDCDPSPSILCVPPSGSFFPRGTTMVACTATDLHGNQTVCMFPVLVLPTVRLAHL